MRESLPDAVKQRWSVEACKRCYVLNRIFKFSRLLQTYLQERLKKKEEKILEAVD